LPAGAGLRAHARRAGGRGGAERGRDRQLSGAAVPRARRRVGGRRRRRSEFVSGGGVARRLFTRGPRRADLSVVARIVGIAWAVAVLLVQGCVSMTHADVTAYAEPEGFTVTADALPPGARPISALAYEKLGFYVLGLVPIVPVDLHRGVARLVKEARELGADGLAHLRYEFRPAS